MKKILLVFAVFLLLSACAQVKQDATAPSGPVVQEPVQARDVSVPSEPAKEQVRVDQMPYSEEKRGEMAKYQSADLQKAFTAGMQKCSYRLNDVLVSAWILTADRFRIETAVPGARISTVYDGNVVYSWDDRTKMGVRISIEDIPKHADERVAGMAIPKTPVDATAGATNVVCVLSTALGEDIIDIPGNVQFTNVGELMRGVEELN